MALIIQVADDSVGRLTHGLRQHLDGKLLLQVVGQSDGRGEERLKRRLIHRLRRRTLETGVEIFIEERPEVDFLKGVGILLGV